MEAAAEGCCPEIVLEADPRAAEEEASDRPLDHPLPRRTAGKIDRLPTRRNLRKRPSLPPFGITVKITVTELNILGKTLPGFTSLYSAKT